MPRGVYDRGAKAKKSKAQPKVAAAPKRGNDKGLLEIVEHSLDRREHLCDMLDRCLDRSEDLIEQLEVSWKHRATNESLLKSATLLLRRLDKWSAGKPIDSSESELISVLTATTALLNEMDRKYQPS